MQTCPTKLISQPGGAEYSSEARLLAISAPTADTWQSLYNLYWVLAIAAGTITIGALVFFATKYRAKPGSAPVSHEDNGKVPIRTVLLIVVIMASVLAGAGYASFSAIGVYNSPPGGWNNPNALHVNVTAQRFSWSFNCTSGCSVAGVLNVHVGQVVILNITSIDVFHSFGIPDLRVKADAIPGRFNLAWFEITKAGQCSVSLPCRIQCYELCGSGHAFMIAKLVVT